MWLKKITRRIMSVYVLVEYYIKLHLEGVERVLLFVSHSAVDYSKKFTF